MAIPTYQAKLTGHRELCPEVREFHFEAIDTPQLPFVPGQFVSMFTEIGGKKITRAYSIASRPEANRFTLCLNLVREGLFSPHLFAMRPGDTVQFRGPLGVFTLRNPVRDSVMVATGTGIAPMRSMLLDYLPRNEGHNFTLLFGARYRHGLLYREDFEDFEKRFETFRFLPTITRPDEGWTGRTGRVQAHLDDALAGRRDVDVYICGLKEMVDEVRTLLKDHYGFDRKQIIYEKYD